jgi:SAM-dependent methyltransferase
VTASSHTCDVCGSSEWVVAVDPVVDYITGKTFRVQTCGGCGVATTAPRPSAMDAYYPSAYRRYGGATAFTLRQIYRAKVRGWLRRLPRHGRALEVGCGAGWMLRGLRDHGWQVFGNERTVSDARVAVSANAIPVFVGDLDALSNAEGLDLLILFQVLEHLESPVTVLRRVAGLLAAGGVVVVGVPNVASWQARWFGASWFHFDVPRHLYHFSPKTLASACERAGLRVTRTRFVSFEHEPYGWVQSTLNWMGFEQNLLTRMLMGMDRRGAGLMTLVPMLLLAGVLVVPSILLSLCSWSAGAGAIMEVWAVRRDPD